jgi:hypothetical protein
MSEYQKRTPDVSGLSGSAFSGDFAAFVCVYPAIHSASRATAGDHKVQVRSYEDILELIRSRGKTSTTQRDWDRFAQEHLSLTAVTLEEATDSRVQDSRAVLDASASACAQFSRRPSASTRPHVGRVLRDPYARSCGCQNTVRVASIEVTHVLS